MRCSPELLDAYVDGELTEAERRRLERHLASCGRCRAEVEELRALKTLLRDSAPKLEPAQVQRRVAEIMGEVRFREARRQRRRPLVRFLQGALAGGLAATVAAAAVWGVVRLGGETGGGPSAPISTVDAVVAEHSRRALLLEAGVDDWYDWHGAWE